MLSLTRLASIFALGASLATAQTHTGDGTFFTPGLGACGMFNTAADSIVAVSTQFFTTFPGAGANPNLNPACGKRINIRFQGKTAEAVITDECAGCAGEFDLDMSPAVFNQLANPAVGRLHGVTWEFQ